MEEIAAALGKTVDGEFYKNRAEKVRRSIMENMLRLKSGNHRISATK